MSSLASSGYRRDIDGLRGLSILAVVFFHATGALRGGFIGVDVFFVISGYLIAGILLREMERGQLNLANFWVRRIRRIMPASVAMSVVTLGLGCLILLPEDLVSLAKSAMAQALMVSNVFFWQDSGYFAAASDQKPFLHTWSLSVEEQFYLVFPFVCWAVMKRYLRRGSSEGVRPLLLKLFAAALLISLGISIYQVGQEPTMAFYLLPSRAWELLVGATLACLPSGCHLSSAKTCRRLGELGFFLLIICAVQMRDLTPFPGLLALPPCLGAALLIWVHSPTQPASPSHWLRRVMESRFLVGLGLISYSLYLWHWPFLAYWEYLNVSFSRSTGHVVKALLMLLAVALAYVSWRWIETPWRKHQPGGKKLPVFAAGILAMLALLGAGALLIQQAGLPARWSEKALRYAAAIHQMGIDEGGKTDSLEATLAKQPPRFGSTRPDAHVQVLVWGDSHARCLSPALAALCEEHDVAGCLTAYSSTPALLGFVQPGVNGLAEKSGIWGEAILGMIRDQKIPHVLLVSHWKRSTKRREAEFGQALLNTVKRVRELGAEVWVVKDVPAHEMIIPKALALHATLPALFPDPTSKAITEAAHREQNAVMESLTGVLQDAGAHVIDPTPLMLDAEKRGLIVDGGVSLYADVGHHLSVPGALRLKPLFLPLFGPLKSSK
jgi:peptidoglycan/LPS O-acetylase OafA/YrhL